jgi:hypothetical protein
MKRLLFNIVAAASGVLLMLNVVLCFLNYLHPEEFTFTSRNGLHTVGVGISPYWRAETNLPAPASPRDYNLYLARYLDQDVHGSRVIVITAEPIILQFPAGAMMAWWAIRRSKERTRRRLGFCTKCGYDLRVSKDECPECGAMIEPTTPAKP